MPLAEQAEQPVVLVLGPHRAAISGVSTHINLLFDSALADSFRLRHFQVGSEGRTEGLAARLARLLTSPFALAATLIAEQVDVMHINTSLNRRAYWRDLSYMVVARLLGVCVLYQVHGGNLRQFSARSRFLAPLLHASLRLPAVIIVLARCELASYRRLVPGQAVRLLPNGIDLLPYSGIRPPPTIKPASNNPSSVRAEPFDLAQGEREFDCLVNNGRTILQLLYIGRLSRDKGLYEALHGLQLARAQGVSAHLTIAGGGPDEAALRQEAGALQLDGDVSFVGAVFGDAKLKLLASSDALLLPSYSEGLPYALLECMAAGVPAITTPVGAIPDVVTDGLHGLFVPPRNAPAIAQAIGRLAADPDGLSKMSMACRKRVASGYSVQRLVQEFAGLYSEFGAPRSRNAATGL